jgi:uncharacterized membrane protein
MIPVVTAIVFSIALPWTEYASHGSYLFVASRLAAHALVAAFAVFIIWWGVRQASKGLVNLGVVGFAIVVAWFYFSNIMDKLGRSLGLIGLGILFLAGGWALERTRRKLVTGMKKADVPAINSQEAL